MGVIFRINENELPWMEYAPSGDSDGPAPIRVKALTLKHPDVPSAQFIEYAPGHADPVHSHDTDEVFIVTAGELWLAGEDTGNGPGSIVFVPRDTDYSVRAGAEGVRYFRIVVS